MDLETYRLRFPEHNTVRGPQIDDAIAQAAREIDAASWGVRADDAIGLLAAHYIAISPGGMNARVETKGVATSSYYQQYLALRRTAAACLDRVAP